MVVKIQGHFPFHMLSNYLIQRSKNSNCISTYRELNLNQ